MQKECYNFFLDFKVRKHSLSSSLFLVFAYHSRLSQSYKSKNINQTKIYITDIDRNLARIALFGWSFQSNSLYQVLFFNFVKLIFYELKQTL